MGGKSNFLLSLKEKKQGGPVYHIHYSITYTLKRVEQYPRRMCVCVCWVLLSESTLSIFFYENDPEKENTSSYV